eukprot:6189911-Pleurochrysis_carterae.AAC.1
MCRQFWCQSRVREMRGARRRPVTYKSKDGVARAPEWPAMFIRPVPVEGHRLQKRHIHGRC